MKEKTSFIPTFRLLLLGLIVLPVAWILLNDKKGRTYKILFKQIIALAKTRGYLFRPSNIMSDYESGIISTLKEVVMLCQNLRMKAYYSLFLVTSS